jgi:4-amino-4-deoxy-L-arabinose transferase-like glycosyltransferase
MNKKLVYILFGIIIGIALVLRLYQLGHIPASPDWDEVALGYDAYSIIHTGKDEFGKFLPVVLRSFDDYKPALYTYLAIPFVYLLGLSVFAVRMPSVIFGVIGVIATFYLVKELFKRDDLALVSSFMMAISPWSIQFSRVAFESNTGDTLNILAALFLIKGRKKPWMLFLSAFFAGLSLYIYQSEKVFTPLFILVLVIIFCKDFIKLPKKYLVTAVVIGLITVYPMVHFILSNKEALLRVQGTSIFSNQTQILQNDIQELESDHARHDYLGLLLDNRRIEYGKIIISGYLSHFDPNWLMSGDISRHHAPNMGLIYIWEFPFILIGIFSLVFGAFDKKTKAAVLSWFLIAPIPASITTGVPHAVRTLNFLPTWQIFTALGLITSFYFIKNLKVRIGKYNLRKPLIVVCVTVFGLFAVLNFVYYLNQYFVQLNYYDGFEWQYGYEKVVPALEKFKKSYTKIVVSDREPMDKSYMFFLFYLKYPPQQYQTIGQNSSGGFAAHHAFDKFEFRPIDWQHDATASGILLVGVPSEFPPKTKALKTIYYQNEKKAMMIVDPRIQ